MVRRFGSPTLDAASGKVEYAPKRPQGTRKGAWGRVGDLPPVDQKCPKTLGFPCGTG